MIPDEMLDQIRRANPLADVVREAGIELKPVGKELIGLCPFHDDHHPSLSVNEAKGVFLRRSCGKGGDAFKFVMLLEGLTFPQAAEKLARRAGISLDGIKTTPPTQRREVCAYDYRDENDKLLFQAVRFVPKDFRQRRPDGKGGWVWNLQGVRLVPYRLGEVLNACNNGKRIIVAEGEKDCDMLAALGFTATCNPMGAGKWKDAYTATLTGAHVVIIADKDGAGRKHAAQVRRELEGKAASVRVIELPGREGRKVKDAADWIEAGGTAAELEEIIRTAPEWEPPVEKLKPSATADPLQAAITDPRPKVQLPGEDYLLSAFASALGKELSSKGMHRLNHRAVVLRDGELRTVTPQEFRTLAEQHVICYRQQSHRKQVYEVGVTMTEDNARGVLASPQFLDQLFDVRCVNSARLPVLRVDGRLELLPEGYDMESKTLTMSGGLAYNETMDLEAARIVIDDLLAEFYFADGQRSKAVAIAAMLSLYCNGLLPDKSLRPAFVYVANAEGAGKSILAACAIVPTMGRLPTGSKADTDDEMRKVLLTTVREARQLVFLDNVKGKLSSGALEGFLSAPTWSDRLLGVNEFCAADNRATVFITGNGLTVSPDMRRRSLFADLHLGVERAEDRKFSRVLDVPTLLAMRADILAALWALVRHWNESKRPAPSRGHSAFPTWANIIGGIVEAAGYDCPLETAQIAATADQDGDDMRRLVEGMEVGTALTFGKVVAVAKEKGCFENIIGGDNAVKRADRVKLSRLLARYDKRLAGQRRFVIEGKGHNRKYRVEEVDPAACSHAEHAVSNHTGKDTVSRIGLEEHAEHVEHAKARPSPIDDDDVVKHRAYRDRMRLNASTNDQTRSGGILDERAGLP